MTVTLRKMLDLELRRIWGGLVVLKMVPKIVNYMEMYWENRKRKVWTAAAGTGRLEPGTMNAAT